MKGLKFARRGTNLSVRWIILALALLAVTFQTRAQIITLTHNNSSASIAVNSQAGMFNWSVLDGNGIFQNQLAQQWFWYRVGAAGPEQSIDTISAASITTPDARTLYTRYNNGAYGVEVDYILTGQSPNSYKSALSESITITNETASPLDFHFFQYSDFDLLGTAGGDTVQLLKSGGKFNLADQIKGSSALSETVTSGGDPNNPGADHGETAFYNATLIKLNNAGPDNLNDIAGPTGPGDVTWALQWGLTIPAGRSILISKEKSLDVPEPSALALVALGLIASVARRRRQ